MKRIGHNSEKARYDVDVCLCFITNITLTAV